VSKAAEESFLFGSRRRRVPSFTFDGTSQGGMATVGRRRESGRREAFHAGIFPGRGLRFNMDKVTVTKEGDEIPNIYPSYLLHTHTHLRTTVRGIAGFPSCMNTKGELVMEDK
jgi:hypothetical protein